MKTESSPVSNAWALPGSPYLDASALLKIYLPEPGSETLEQALRGRGDLMVSDLAVTEVTSVLGRRRREGTLPAPDAARLHRMLRSDLSANLYLKAELDSDTHQRAEQLLLSTAVPLRAGDALHLALALAARAGVIVTFDIRLARAAREAGIGVVPATEN